MAMYTVYATKTELAAYLGVEEVDLPIDADRLLARASDQIYSMIKNNYDSTDTDHVAAVKKAVCAQVEYFIHASETPTIVPGIKGMSAGSTSISFGQNADRSQQSLSARVLQYLNDFGLLYRGATLRFVNKIPNQNIDDNP